MQKTQIVTTALLYANGPLHLGHLVEHIQADTWVRFKRMNQQDCIFIGGNDAHGTPIMLSANKQGVRPEELIRNISLSHQQDLAGFNIHYDEFANTHDNINQTITYKIFDKLQQENFITTKEIEQPYDAVKNMFLPDRYIKGTCPKCKSSDQYGDNCEACGATYDPLELIDPKSVISNTSPIKKQSTHYFFQLSACTKQIKDWLDKANINQGVKSKLTEWFTSGLKDWDISRDNPYFGFLIPGESDKYFYVWLDAPIGYMAIVAKYCHKNGIDFEQFWNTSEIIHFIGKDITYFHALFWPALLLAANINTPSTINTHGFLTVNGQKMSKSRNTFITAKDYLENLDPNYFRYYICSKSNSGIQDIDLNWQDFKNKIDSELVGKISNIASRSAKFIAQYFDNMIINNTNNLKIYNQCQQEQHKIYTAYNERNFSSAITQITSLADIVNQYIAMNAPWALAKANPYDPKIQEVCSHAIQCFMCLCVYLKPIIPDYVSRAEKFLNFQINQWSNCDKILTNHKINNFNHLIDRVPLTKINNE